MTDTRAESLEEARKFQKLGDYPKSHVQFIKASEQSDDLALATDVAGMWLEQGCPKKSLDKINGALIRFSETCELGVLASAEILKSFAMTFSTTHFSGPLKTGVDLYNQHLHGLAPDRYEKWMVTVLDIYLLHVSLAGDCGFDISSYPKPSLAFLQSLYEHLLLQGQYGQALQIAVAHGSMAQPHFKTQLLEQLLAVPDLPDLDKALGLMRYSGILSQLDQNEAVIANLEAAKYLYIKTKHCTGSLLADIQIFKINLNGPDPELHNSKSDLLRLMAELEKYQDYNGVSQAHKCLYQLAYLQQDNAFRVELDQESLRLAEIRGFPLDWIVEQYQIVRRWERAGPSTGQMLQTLEAIYENMLSAEAPEIRIGVANLLARKYRSIGDAANTEKWIAEEKRQDTPRYARFLDGTDEFYNNLERVPFATSDHEGELRDLREELQQILCDIRTAPTGCLHFGVLKVMHICGLYIDRFKLRDFAQVQRLVGTCLEYTDDFIRILPELQKKKWEAEVLGVRGKLFFIKAQTCGKPMSEARSVSDLFDQVALSQSIEAYTKAESLYIEAGEKLNAAQTQQQLANCYVTKWDIGGRSPTSPFFALAVKNREAARETLEVHGTYVQQRLAMASFVRLWKMGYDAKVGYRDPLEETVGCLIQLEKLIDDERQDLSALGQKEAILAKQNMRRDQHISLIYDIAPQLFASMGDGKKMWEWVQKSKARSLSDLLGLGVNMSTHLRSRIESDSQAVSLLAKEEQLVGQVRSAPAAAQLMVRKEIETHRERMRSVESLRELLDLRQGVPVSWSRLSQLSSGFSDKLGRRTWFVDWYINDGSIFTTMVSNDEENYLAFKLSITLAEVDEWIRKNLSKQRPLHGEDDFELLVPLRGLIEAILEFTKENDLLVLCASGSLHRVPIHAAIIDEKPDMEDTRKIKTLTERNPIIYAASMTTFQQCITRSINPIETTGTPMDTNTNEGVVLGIYEEPADPSHPYNRGWKDEREKIYSMCRDLSSDMGWGEPFCGVDAGRLRFEAACQANIVHFSGHFDYNTNDVLSQGIVLSPKDDALDVFTVADIFATKVIASHFSLIGCASAVQDIQRGDEPLSIVAALLCAGARSVAGTLWSIDSKTGREFSGEFYKHFKRDNDRRHPVDLAIALQKTVKYIREGEDKAPYFWAAFVVHGAYSY